MNDIEIERVTVAEEVVERDVDAGLKPHEKQQKEKRREKQLNELLVKRIALNGMLRQQGDCYCYCLLWIWKRELGADSGEYFGCEGCWSSGQTKS